MLLVLPLSCYDFHRLYAPRAVATLIPVSTSCRIVFAFRQYARCTENEIQRWEHNYRALSARHRTLLAHLPAKAAAARRAVAQNLLFIKALLLSFAGEDEDEEQQQQQQADGAEGSSNNSSISQGADGSAAAEGGDDEAVDGSSGVPGGLAAGALRYADQLEAEQQQCTPGDAEKVGWSRWWPQGCCLWSAAVLRQQHAQGNLSSASSGVLLQVRW